MRPRSLFVALAAGIAMAAGLVMALRMNAPAQPAFSTVYPEPQPLTEFSLLDQHGSAFTAASFEGQWDIVFFGFTSCPDICPTTMQKLSLAQRQVTEAGHAEQPRIVLVSVDPERDTPELIGRYVDHFGDGSLGVTGELEEVEKLTKQLGIYFAKVPLEGGDYTVDHSAAVLVIAPDATPMAVFAGLKSADEYAHDLPILMELY